MNLQELVLKYKRKKDVDLLATIIKTLRPIIHKKALILRRYLPRHDVKDLEQDLVILIMNLLNKYNSKRSKFITYLMIRFKGDPLKILQKQVAQKRGGRGYWNLDKQKKTTISLFANSAEYSHKTILETLKDPTNYKDIINDVIIRRDVLSLLQTIEERKIFDMMYIWQLSVRVIAKKIKKNQKETSKLIRTIRQNPEVLKICSEIKYR